MQLSVIIPSLNEAATLPRLLLQLRAQRDLELDLIVADGGSSDGTPALAAAHGVRVVASTRGRGQQMNTGAQAAVHAWLLFLHADSQLPQPQLLHDALAALIAAGGNTAGHFPLRFERAGPGHEPFYRYHEGKTRLNRPYTINGDQGLLISAEWFCTLGGFDESLPFLEDQRIAARIFAQGRWLLLPGELLTSARRFETEGHYPRRVLMALMMGLHAAGANEFFARAPGVYATQDRAARLDLQPFLRLARQVLAQRGRLRTLWHIAAFSRDNLWQVFYGVDVRLGGASWLRFYDRWIGPLMSGLFGQALVTIAMSFWFYCWMPLRALLRFF